MTTLRTDGATAAPGGMRLAGFINLDKPSGPTSHDMVALVRRTLRIKQVGHAGTLDPLATGVLVIGVGAAARLMSFVGAQPKEYVARLLLGRSTDTEDITGKTEAEASSAGVTLDDLERAAGQLRGPILQTPPMVSAVRHQGRRLYELAREGRTVERKPRPVTIYSLEIRDFQPGEAAEATLLVRCSGGVYVRTLCAEIGRILGCGGCMAALRRTAVGSFRAENAVDPSSLEARGAASLLPPMEAVRHLHEMRLTEEEERGVSHGNPFERAGSPPPGPRDGDPLSDVRLHSEGGELVAIAHTLYLSEDRQRYQPYLVFTAPAAPAAPATPATPAAPAASAL